MKQLLVLALAWIAVGFSGCSSPGSSDEIAHDLSTPEGAILSLEDAYRAKDIDAAIACKDFKTEASLMLQELQQELSGDEEVLLKTAEVLELGFRSEMKGTGFPDFEGVTSTFSNKRPFKNRDGAVRITETCRLKNGATAKNELVVVKTSDGWKLVSVVE